MRYCALDRDGKLQVSTTPANDAGAGETDRQTRAQFPFGLGQQGVHELTASRFGDHGAMTGLALQVLAQHRAPTLWITERTQPLDHGALYGLAPALGRAAHGPIMVEAQRPVDALWACEEAVRAGVVPLVVAEVPDLNFTASRRLLLASEKSGVALVLILPRQREGSTAATARWRVASAPAAPAPFDPAAPGLPRWSVTLERARHVPDRVGETFLVEHDEAALSLCLVDALGAEHPDALPLRRQA